MTDDEKAMIEWWNSLPNTARSFWIETGGAAVVVDAWKCFKRHQTKIADSDAKEKMDVFLGDHLVHVCTKCGWIGGTNELSEGPPADCPKCSFAVS